MKVAKAEQGAPIEAGHVYVNCPNSIITVSEHKFHLARYGGERNPIDVTLASLAACMPRRTIAVMLEGTGRDGALGVASVREAGGLTLAQCAAGLDSAHTASDKAAASRLADAALPIEVLPARLAEYIAGIGAAAAPQAPDSPPSLLPSEVNEIHALLRAAAGHDCTVCRTTAFTRRVLRRMRLLRIADPADYTAILRRDPDEAGFLCREFLNAAHFSFSDAPAHEALAALALPQLAQRHSSGDTLRVWVPGCATGEAAYAIAMLLREQDSSPPARQQIFATDSDENVLAIARAGRYPALRLASLSAQRLARFFVAEGASYVVARDIRDTCMFARHDLTQDAPFSRLDLIACHRLPLHLDDAAQARIAAHFHYALRDGGFIFEAGHGLARRHPELFKPLDAAQHVFQRRDRPARQAGRTSLLPARIARDAAPGAHAARNAVAAGQSIVLENHAPAHIVTDRHGQVLHFSVRTGKYLEPAYGAPNRAVIAMARPGLGEALDDLLHEAARSGRAAYRDTVLVHTRDGKQAVRLSAQPIPGPEGDSFWLIVFEDAGAPTMTTADAAAAPAPADPLLWRLQTELADTRVQLHAAVEQAQLSIEELRTANEDMASVNQELQSGNAELEISQAELQALNEELHAVNTELTAKVAELDHATSDMRNLLDSTRIATLFLNDRLELRVFTPAASYIFKLTRADYGRSILDLASTLEYSDLAADVAATLASRAPVERRVATRDGAAHFLVRLLPYRKADDSIDGVVLTFVDITSLLELGEQRALVAELNHRVKNVLAVVMSVASQLARRSTSIEGFTAALADRINGLAKTHDILSRNKWVSVDLRELVTSELRAFVADPARLMMSGPPVHLPARAVTALGCVIHELATNAAKYGALASEHGGLRVTWSQRDRHGDTWLTIVWREAGGPPAAKPRHAGFGTELTRRTLEYEFEGSAKFDYRETGLVVTLAMPMRHFLHPG